MAEAACWWCGAPADSREHKFAAAELRLNHGAGSWGGESAVVHFNSDLEIQDVRGAKADILKWEPNLCQTCNNSRSQPFDRAYLTLLKYIDQNEAEVGSTGAFKFSDVYGDRWVKERANLIKYWLKHICCRAAVIGLAIPRAVIEYLNDESALGNAPHTALVLVVNDEMYRFQMEHGFARGSGFGDAQGIYWGRQLVGFESFLSWGWLGLQYNFDISNPMSWISFPDDLVEMSRVTADED